MPDVAMIIMMAVIVVLLLVLMILLINLKNKGTDNNMGEELYRTRKEISERIDSQVKASSDAQDKRLAEMNQKLSNMSVENEQKLENIRNTMEKNLRSMAEDNNKQLERMRSTVDEKLQETLEKRISESFKLVNDRLEQVYKGLGEMHQLAEGVGDLKKVLSNVKTRGILGEVQLSAILEQILTKDQYDENVATKKGSSDRVEFAIRLPGDGDSIVYLPIDAKFPLDKYERLRESYENGTKDDIDAAKKDLETFIRLSAKTIHEKYIDVPNTTEFGILFLPVEGLYAEVVNGGLVEELQSKYKVNIAGPTTMAALLNSLQMGFRTLAIEKHSSEVWKVLGAVKTEFGKFEEALKKAQNRIDQAHNELDTLIGTRSNVMRRSLRSVEQLPEKESNEILGITDEGDI